MQKQGTSKPLKCLSMLTFLLLFSIITILIFTSNISLHHLIFTNLPKTSHVLTHFPHPIQSQVSDLQTRIGFLLQQLHNENSESRALTKFSDQVLHIAVKLDKLADSLTTLSGNAAANVDRMSKVIHEDFHEHETEDEEESTRGSVNVFRSGELQNYISSKPNRQSGKKNFLGVEAISPSIGLSCAHMAPNVDRFMTYKIYGMCPDDWDMAQKLMASGCEPLPKRRCFSRSPPKYTKPLPVNISLWKKPNDANILWTHYKCKDYSCLVSNEVVDNRGFFKCSDCFNLSRKGWEHTPSNESSPSPEFTVDEVLGLKPGEIRIGLDFSHTTGGFAALMREKNVMVASATLNLGAPYSEVIALRGLLPLYVSVGSRLPFFDNTLDMVHSTLFLDGWIGIELLQYVLFDWDRVVRPKGILWIDRFFCKKEDMGMYLKEFERLGYKKLLWRVVPKIDKLGDELFFSAVLEKPIRK